MDEINCMPKYELSIEGVRANNQDLLFPKGYDTGPLKSLIDLFNYIYKYQIFSIMCPLT